MVAGLGTAAFFQFARSGLDTQEQPSWDNTEEVHRDIDQMNIEQTWELWKLVRDQSIGPYRPPTFIVSRLWSAAWFRTVIAGLAAAGIGFLMMAGASFFRSRSDTRKRPATGKSRE
jgi:hypothetical protein